MKKTTSCACAVVAAALLLGPLGLAAAESARFRYLAAAYADAKGAGLSLPEGIACGSNGQFVVGDTGNDRLLRFAFSEGAAKPGTEIKIPELSAPTRVQLNSKGEIFALDAKQRRIVRIGPEGEFKAALSPEGIPAPATIIPKDFAVDASDNIYVLDVFAGRVLVLNAEGQFQKALPFPEGTRAGSGIAIGVGGDVLLLDAVARRMFSASADAKAFAPLGGDLGQYVATLPTSMTASKGIIFFVESGGSIVGFGRDGSFLTRQLSAGWNEGQLNHPAQMCVNDKDEAFIADRDNSRVQVFQVMR